MGAINPAGVYGLARGLTDADSMDREKQAFDLDQQTRRARLQSEQELAPLRKRSLELGVQDAEHAIERRPVVEKQQDDLSALNIDVTKLKKGELEAATQDAATARRVHQTLANGARDFQLSGDPTHIADAFQKVDPRFAGTKATRNDDGSITLDGGQGKPITFRGQTKAPDGTKLSPEDEVLHFMAQYADPLKSFQEKYGYAEKKGLEDMKDQRAIAVAREGAGARRYAADAQAESKDDAGDRRAIRDEVKGLPKAVDNILRTKSESGSFIAGYAHADDAELSGVIRAQAKAKLKANKDKVLEGDYSAEDAALEASNDVRAAYDKVDTSAKAAAQALAKKKISPRDRKAVEAAAASGDADAKQLLKVIEVAKKNLGSSIAKYLESNLPAK